MFNGITKLLLVVKVMCTIVFLLITIWAKSQPSGIELCTNFNLNTLLKDSVYELQINPLKYYNPLSNTIDYNKFNRLCEKYIDPLGDYKLIHLQLNKRLNYTRLNVPYVIDGIHAYFNTDSLLIMNGSFEAEKPHGIFWIYCEDDFPYCPEASQFPLRQIIYYEGEKLSDVRLNNNGQPIEVMKIKSQKFRW